MKNHIILLLLVSIASFGQTDKAGYNILSSSIPEEATQIETNTSVLLSGEYLYYKVFLFNTKTNTYSNISKLTYVELLGIDGNVLFKHKLKTKNGIAHGDFFIPASVKTGEYLLIAYTNWSKNNKQHLTQPKKIYVINPFSSQKQNENIQTNTVEITKAPPTFTKSTKTPFSIKTNKVFYSSREKIDININTQQVDNTNSYSLSVKKVDSIAVSSETKTNNDYSISLFDKSLYALPEIRGEIISGNIKTAQGSAAANKTVLLSIPGKNFVYKNTLTDQNGQFIFILNHYQAQDAIIEVQGKHTENYIISVDSLSHKPFQNTTFNKVVLSPKIGYWLKTKSIQNQIENAFFEKKQHQSTPHIIDKPFFSGQETIYKLDDYNRFPTVEETFVEIIPIASLTVKEDNYTFDIKDFGDEKFNKLITTDNPLILVDGVTLENHNEIVNYNAYNIESISVVQGNYIYGSKIYAGIISFTTKKGNFASLINNPLAKHITIEPPVEDKIYYQPDYSGQDLSKTPDFRTQLLWLPNITLNTKEQVFSCYTSDVKGTFQIKLSGYQADGKKVQAFHYFTVE